MQELRMSRDILNQRKIVSKKFSCGKVCGKYIRKYEAECFLIITNASLLK